MKKRIFSALLAVLMVVLLLPVQAIAADKVIKGAFVGQNFDATIGSAAEAKAFSKSGSIPEGLTLSGSWKETNNRYVLQMKISGTPTKAGTYNFTVNYLKDDLKTVVQKVSYTMTVGEKPLYDYVKSIRIDKWPTKTTYYLGDRVDLTGLKVSALVYNYDAAQDAYVPSEIDVTDLVWVEPEIFTFDETQNVDVCLSAPGKANGELEVFKDHFRVDFKYADASTIMRMEIYQKPTKLTYTVGETLDTTGMTIRLHKGDGSAQDVTTGFKTDVTTLSEVGTKTVTVTYGEGDAMVSATFSVEVKEKVEEPVSSSSSSSVPETPSTSSEPEVPSEPVSESSEPEVPSESEPVIEEPSSESESESESEPDVIVIGGDANEPTENNNNGGIPFWVWIIIGLLVILIAAAVALFIIGRKRIDD